ncbi:MAG: TRAP transporter large permease [Oscillospiraceae bacterium]|jgi:tripartite ATP-independent transporter DctM subunit|nr:TRAP transporter large permease [Oscillospiraceae bacterium]
MDLTLLGIIGILVMIGLTFLGMNMGMSMFLVGLVGYWVATGSWKQAIFLFRTVPFSNASSYTMVVIPLFVLMGAFALMSGMGKGLYDCCEHWLGRLPGGLSFATLVACGGFGAICGATNATVLTMGRLAYPEMKRFKYDGGLSLATAAAGGTLSWLIPPSTGFILYGVIATCSVGRLFAAGIIPGVILLVAYIVACTVLCIINPSLGPKGQSYTMKEKLKSLVGLIPIVVLFAAVIGGMFSGIFSATEAAAVGCLLAFLYTVFTGKFTFKGFTKALGDSVKSICMVFLIMLGAYVFGYFLTATHLPQDLANLAASMNVNRYVIMLIIVVIYFLLGMVMDSMATVLLTVPIFLPVATSLGFDPIWFGVVIVLIMCAGSITPPICFGVFVSSTISSEVALKDVFKRVVPYCIAIFAVTVLIILFPSLSTWLPTLIYGPVM